MKKSHLIPLIITGIIIIFIILFLILNFFILKNTAEYYQHNVFGDTDNIVFLHPDGHEEMVIDEEGNPVLIGPNAASYNFCHPMEDPYCHFRKDTWPWIKWGNSPDDPTTVQERRQAFLRDYFEGVRKMLGLID